MSKKMVVSPPTDENTAVAVAAAEEWRNWEGLNPEILALVFVRMPVEEMVSSVPLVCKSWMEVVAGPYCWSDVDLVAWCRRRDDSHAVDLVVKKLVRRSKFRVQRLSAYRMGESAFFFVAHCHSYFKSQLQIKHNPIRPVTKRIKTDTFDYGLKLPLKSRLQLLLFMYFFSGNFLKVLQMPVTDITDKMVLKHIKPLPNLTVLDISHCKKITSKGLAAFGQQCKSLLHLKRHMPAFNTRLPADDSEAKTVADTMPHLQHIELCFGRFGDSGLSEILTKCKALAHLDIQGSWNVALDGGLAERCEKLPYFKNPWIEYDDEFSDTSEGNEVDPSVDDNFSCESMKIEIESID